MNVAGGTLSLQVLPAAAAAKSEQINPPPFRFTV